MTAVAVMLAFAAGAAVAILVAMQFFPEKNRLDAALEAYEREMAEGKKPSGERTGFKIAGLRRLLERGSSVGQVSSVVAWTETRLDQANLALRPPEALLLYAVGVLVFGGGGMLIGGLFPGTLLLLVFSVLPPAVLVSQAKKRLRLFNAQLPDALTLMSSTLRAGYSFLQGVDAVSQEVKEPMAAELRRVMVEAQLGRPVEEALEDCALRMKSADFEWAVRAVAIQREVGGNLSELLDIVAETMLDRERLRRDVRGLTAEGRMSAIVLGLLPPGVGLLFYVKNPTYIKVLFDNSGGQVALAAAAVAMVVGFLWMNKVIQIEV